MEAHRCDGWVSTQSTVWSYSEHLFTKTAAKDITLLNKAGKAAFTKHSEPLAVYVIVRARFLHSP